MVFLASFFEYGKREQYSSDNSLKLGFKKQDLLFRSAKPTVLKLKTYCFER
ncbi:hypothetical protein HMPREF0653_01147 [Prevotella disiens JCM 6334 = ATCC 29426]|uniref:Uncharacterized protein n=1 Tax=Prevotella disiens JCM 6334 = ATCC 29426 TaxID=1235811 RepID=A0ABP2Y897_9BACT|nr:hypothetical protein HMPREF0653_01147 [Prevotella disiens JCM 6334 = ATCC 29426]